MVIAVSSHLDSLPRDTTDIMLAQRATKGKGKNP